MGLHGVCRPERALDQCLCEGEGGCTVASERSLWKSGIVDRCCVRACVSVFVCVCVFVR